MSHIYEQDANYHKRPCSGVAKQAIQLSRHVGIPMHPVCWRGAPVGPDNLRDGEKSADRKFAKDERMKVSSTAPNPNTICI